MITWWPRSSFLGTNAESHWSVPTALPWPIQSRGHQRQILWRVWLPDLSRAKSDKLSCTWRFQSSCWKKPCSLGWIIGYHGVGKCNRYGLLLLKTSTMLDLHITNTVFHFPKCNKMSWMHSCCRHWYLTDYIIMRRCKTHVISVPKVMCSAECWIDHCLIVYKLNIHIKPKQWSQDRKMTRRLNVSKLKFSATTNQLAETLQSWLTDVWPGGDVEDDWATFKDSVYYADIKFLGPTTGKSKDWFDEND